MGACCVLDTPGQCKRPVMQMLKATSTNTCKHATERVASRRALISARTGQEWAAATAATAATAGATAATAATAAATAATAAAAREIQICQLGHLYVISGENRLLRVIFEAERR